MAELVREAVIEKVDRFAQSEDVEMRLEEDLQRRRDAAKRIMERAPG